MRIVQPPEGNYCSGGCDVKAEFFANRRGTKESEITNLAHHYAGYLKGDTEAHEKATELLSSVVPTDQAEIAAKAMRVCWMISHTIQVCPFSIVDVALNDENSY